jgi:predicted phage tail protein
MREKQIVELVRRAVRGAGGGGGGKGGGGGDAQRAPVEAPDSLRSIQYARVLDLICEGEISGLVAGAQSVYLDNTPLQNADGTYNFSGVTLATTVGTQAQSYLPGFPSVESETAVNVEITSAVSVTRQITNVNSNKVRVTVSVPQLTSQNSTTGDLSGTSVAIAIDLQANGGGYVEQLTDTISGKTTTRYQRSYEIDLAGTAPWDIRLRRSTADSGSVSLVNKTYWSSYTEIIDSKITYPNSALVGIELDASQFNAVPVRGYEMLGALIQVPSNYDPVTRVYTGVWDGTFTTAWSDNPAWAYYFVATHERCGLGNYIDAASIDKWALYEIGQYCDALVDDGFGGTEPRFTCNLYLQTREEAYKVLANMASIFRGMAYWGAGSITAVADMPADAAALYTAANVIGGQFSYQGSAKNTRHTVALVAWNDPDDAYRQKIEYVEDITGIARYGVNETEIVAFGCTSRGQAHRMGRWLLYSERLETETVTFSVALDGIFSPPGSVIQTQDQARAGVRFGGRVASATTSAVTIDNVITIESGKTYTLNVVLPDGTVESSVVTNGIGSATVLSLATALSIAPQTHAIWTIARNDLALETWRVLAVSESGKAQFQITALKHNTSKFDAVENNLVLETAQTTTLTSRPSAVTGLALSESLFEASSGVVNNRATLSWSGSAGRYVVTYRASVGNWVSLPETISQTIDIDGLEAGLYTFSVQQINALGIRSPANSLVATIYGKTAAPADVTGFTVIKSAGIAKAQWALPTDLDVKVGGVIVIRHNPNTSAVTWNNTFIVEEFPGAQVEGEIALMTGTYMAKFRDSSGNYSANAVSFVATEGMVSGFTTVATTTQHSAFTGAKTNVALVGSSIQLDGTTLIDSMATSVDSWPFVDSLGGVSATGSYAFDTYLDLTTSATRRFEADIRVAQFDTGDLIDSRTDLIDDWDDIDGAVVDDCDVVLYAALTDDNPAGSPTWGPWQPFLVSDFTCRAAKFKLDFISGQATHNISCDLLKVDVKTPVSP